MQPSRLTAQRATPLSDGAALSLSALVASGLALGLTNHQCSSDGSFAVFGSNVSRSGYCKLLHFPAFPNSISSLLLTAGLFVSPTLIALLGTVIARGREDSAPLWKSALLSVGIILLSFALIPLAHVRYLGAP